MKQVTTNAIILKRIDYGEADRILTVLTPDHGKLSLLAKGVRKSKSKLAGGLELFTVSDLTYIEGKGKLQTVISTKLQTYHSNITKHMDRVLVGYEVLQSLYKETLQDSEPEYYEVCRAVFAGLDDESVALSVTHVWFILHLLEVTGSSINIEKPINADGFTMDKWYEFSFDDMAFMESKRETISPKEIKFLRVVARAPSPQQAMRIEGAEALADSTRQVLATVLKLHRA